MSNSNASSPQARAGRIPSLVALALAVLAACSPATAPAPRIPPGAKVATFAGGCFWCMEPPFDAVAGVIATTPGYAGGRTPHPTYSEVSGGTTGHAEVVQVTYDPGRVSYRRLLEVFWRNVDPTTPDRQFCDAGTPYRSAIFYHDEEQRQLAEASRAALQRTKPFAAPIVTEIAPAGDFWPAEEEHQDYYLKNPWRYEIYRFLCGRDARLQDLWGKSAR